MGMYVHITNVPTEPYPFLFIIHVMYNTSINKTTFKNTGLRSRDQLVSESIVGRVYDDV